MKISLEANFKILQFAILRKISWFMALQLPLQPLRAAPSYTASIAAHFITVPHGQGDRVSSSTIFSLLLEKQYLTFSFPQGYVCAA